MNGQMNKKIANHDSELGEFLCASSGAVLELIPLNAPESPQTPAWWRVNDKLTLIGFPSGVSTSSESSIIFSAMCAIGFAWLSTFL